MQVDPGFESTTRFQSLTVRRDSSAFNLNLLGRGGAAASFYRSFESTTRFQSLIVRRDSSAFNLNPNIVVFSPSLRRYNKLRGEDAEEHGKAVQVDIRLTLG